MKTHGDVSANCTSRFRNTWHEMQRAAHASSGGYDNLMVEASATQLEARTSFIPLFNIIHRVLSRKQMGRKEYGPPSTVTGNLGNELTRHSA